MSHSTYAPPKDVHPAFDPGLLEGPQHRVLTRIDQFLAQATEWEATLLNVRDKLTKELSQHTASLGDAVPDAHFKDKTASLKEALVQLDKGVSVHAGVIPALAKIVGKPGLVDTQRSARALRELRASYIAQQAVDPNKTSVYRLTKGKHVHDGRLLRPGDTVELTGLQYDAFKDKFEPADAPPAKRPLSPAKAAKAKHTTERVMEKRAKRRRTH